MLSEGVNTENDFELVNGEFTVFVVGQKYYHLSGKKYLKQFLNTKHWISSDKTILGRITFLLSWVQKRTPNIWELVKNLMSIQTSGAIGVFEAIISLTKLFAINEQRANGPEIIDPIIIEEERITSKNLTQYITLHAESSHISTIIVLLKDDNYKRAKTLLSNCPNGMNVKFIENDGKTTTYRVINNGADDINGFLDSFARQCFSTCSKTGHGILTSEEWTSNPIINDLVPTIFGVRSIFLKEHKLNAVNKLKWLDDSINNLNVQNYEDEVLIKTITLINNLFQVYCYDHGGTRLRNSLNIAKELDNELMLAHVYRYSHFFECSRTDKQRFLSQAENTFETYNVYDHAVYCRNNNLIHQFSMDYININEFRDLEGKAVRDTPGLALMSHIINNVGVAYLFDASVSDAIDTFEKGIERANNTHIQKLALMSNKIAALTLNYVPVDEIEAKKCLDEIFYSPSLGLKKMTFLTAQFALNIIAASLPTNPIFASHILHTYKISELIQTAFNTNIMGTGSMIKQLEVLSTKYRNFHLLNKLKLPKKRTDVSGIRLDFICRTGINPFFFNTWL